MTIFVIFIIIILAVSSFVRSSFGFGDALVAMPLLSLFLEVKFAAPIVAFMSAIIAIYILSSSYKQIKFKAVWRLIISSMIGIPFGIIFLQGAAENYIKIFLAVILLVFSLYKLINPKLLRLTNEKYGVFAGFIAGLLGGAYNTNGPPIIIYGTMRNWSPEEFRAILQSIFFPTNLVIIAGHGIAGNISDYSLYVTLISLPFILIATYFGSKINKNFKLDKFQKYVYYLLIALAILMLLTLIFS